MYFNHEHQTLTNMEYSIAFVQLECGYVTNNKIEIAYFFQASVHDIRIFDFSESTHSGVPDPNFRFYWSQLTLSLFL